MDRRQEHLTQYKKNLEKDPAFYRKKAAKWRKEHPDTYNSYTEHYKKSNPVRYLLSKARSRCKKLGLEYNLENEDIIIPEYCPLLNVKLDMNGSSDTSPSLDRLDNTKGYIKGNVWVISFQANRMKNTSTLTQLVTFGRNVVRIFDEEFS